MNRSPKGLRRERLRALVLRASLSASADPPRRRASEAAAERVATCTQSSCVQVDMSDGNSPREESRRLELSRVMTTQLRYGLAHVLCTRLRHHANAVFGGDDDNVLHPDNGNGHVRVAGMVVDDAAARVD